MTDLVNHLQ